MPRMKILNALEQETYDLPPCFNSVERKRFFDFPAGIRRLADEIKTPANKVCFLVTAGYFKATRRLFSDFHEGDIDYVASKLGFQPGSVDAGVYHRRVRAKHHTHILQFYGFRAFNDAVRDSLRQEIAGLVSGQLKPRVLFFRAVEVLVRSKVSPPSYDTLSKLILEVLNQHQRQLVAVIDANLSSEARGLLDTLLEKATNDDDEPINRYRLTLLKKCSQSTRPAKIKETAADAESLRLLYEAVQPSLDALGLPLEAVRYYANSVLRSEIFQVARRSSEDRYLHLIAFITHQYFRSRDTLVDIFSQAIQTVVHAARREHKDQCYARRDTRNDALQALLRGFDEGRDVLQRVGSLVQDPALTDHEKLAGIQAVVAAAQARWESVLPVRQSFAGALDNSDYYSVLEQFSVRMQNRANPILKILSFQGESGAEPLLAALEHFKAKAGDVDKNAPLAFLAAGERAVVCSERFNVSLYKVFLFLHVLGGIKSGMLNLAQSYKHRSLEDYLIPKDRWEDEKETLLQRAGLAPFADAKTVLTDLERELAAKYQLTNQNIRDGKNAFVRFTEKGAIRITTPKAEEKDAEPVQDLFPERRYVALPEVLATVDRHSHCLDEFQHWQQRYHKGKPSKKTFIAGICAIGCDIGMGKIMGISRDIAAAELENTVNWYFHDESLQAVNDRLLQFLNALELPNIYRRQQDVLHTSSDGQKFEVPGDSLNANHSFKYFGKGKGVSVYSFIDERHLLFYSTVISAAERESAYVIDGLMHNDVIKSDIHSTDTHGYTEAIFGVTHLLGFSYAPRIKNLKKQKLYGFNSADAGPDQSWWRVKPSGPVNTELIESQWDAILRLIATIKLKETTASDIFRRLNSYSKQHVLYAALKAFGRIIKSNFILCYIDDVALRQAVERQLNKVESSHRFSRAIAVGNGREMLQTEKEEQEIAEACRRIVKNGIVCWNYLYLTQRITDESDRAARQALLDSVAAGSAVSWQHINLLGEYDFSDEKLRDSVGIKPPKTLLLPPA